LCVAQAVVEVKVEVQVSVLLRLFAKTGVLQVKARTTSTPSIIPQYLRPNQVRNTCLSW
jgi:hypothetical protein